MSNGTMEIHCTEARVFRIAISEHDHREPKEIIMQWFLKARETGGAWMSETCFIPISQVVEIFWSE